jgi:hypothetical protein
MAPKSRVSCFPHDLPPVPLMYRLFLVKVVSNPEKVTEKSFKKHPFFSTNLILSCLLDIFTFPGKQKAFKHPIGKNHDSI